MRDLLIPLVLTVAVALPLAIAGVVAVGWSPLGRVIGMPARAGQGPVGYLLTLLGRSPARHVDWSELDRMLAQVAAGDAHAWTDDRGVSQDSDDAGAASVRRGGFLSHPFVVVALILLGLWIAMWLALGARGGEATPQASPVDVGRAASFLSTGTTWETFSSGRGVTTVIPAEELPSAIASARSLGLETTCYGPGRVVVAGGANVSSCYGEVPGSVSLTASARGEEYLLVLRDMSPVP